MQRSFLAGILLLLLAGTAHSLPVHGARNAAGGKNWVVLIAGSSTYGNYRHQADVCHAYQIVSKKGKVPDSQIIVMMFDDIANSPENPVKGNVINKPGGDNVYPGVLKDYTGKDVNAKNFLSVISGNKAGVSNVEPTGTGRVVESGPDDTIFIYYADHGGVGLVAMPQPPYLYSKDLVATLTAMHVANKYKKLAFYIEACESGSMFEALPADINIFATTAATAWQSSYAFYFDAQRKTYLGDEYSVRWLEDSDTADFGSWTLQDQFERVAFLTNKSEPLEFGDMSLGSVPIGDFQAVPAAAWRALRADPLAATPSDAEMPSSRDVELYRWKNVVAGTQGAQRQQAQARLARVMRGRERADQVFSSVFAKLGQNLAAALAQRDVPQDFECLKASVEGVEAACGKLSDYSLKYSRALVSLCEARQPAAATVVAAAAVCAATPF